MDELDGISNGDDLSLPLAIDLVDHRREGGVLSGACWTHHVFVVRIPDVAIDAQLCPLTGSDVQVRCIPLDHLLEEHAEVHALGGRCWSAWGERCAWRWCCDGSGHLSGSLRLALRVMRL